MQAMHKLFGPAGAHLGRVLRDSGAEAWHVLVPPPGDRHGPLAPLLLTMTAVTGLVDAFSYLTLGHVFVANMTGNVVFLGLALAGASGFSIPASLLAIGAFALGAVGGGRLNAALGHHRGRLLAVTGIVESVLVVVAMSAALTGAQPSSGALRYTLIALLALALGLQNAAARKLAVPDLTTTVLTLTITGIAADSAAAGGPGSRLGRRALAVLAMFVGALVGAALVVAGHGPVSLSIALALVVAVTVAAVAVSRPDAAWASVGP